MKDAVRGALAVALAVFGVLVFSVVVMYFSTRVSPWTLIVTVPVLAGLFAGLLISFTERLR